MKKSELQKKALNFLRGQRIEKLYCVIDGTHMMLNEFEVRYLQAQCTMAPDFEEFCKRVIIHNGPDKDYPVLHFKENGHFEERIIPGFYDAVGTMYLVVMRKERNMVVNDFREFNLY